MISCVNILILLCLQSFRWDLTADKRYTISDQTRAIVTRVDDPMTVQIMLDGEDVNSGFTRLNQAAHDLYDDLHAINTHLQLVKADIPTDIDLQPIVVHERSKKGQMVQTSVYPYAIIRYQNRFRVIDLLQNSPGRSGEENLNASIEGLEYSFAEAISGLMNPQTSKVAFLEGHGELTERDVYDWCRELSRYYQVDRGVLGTDAGALNEYKAVIVAGPQEDLRETDKFILDQYIMQGGRVMWLLDGVRFSEDMLQTSGLTPVIAADWGLRDMLFRYGVRINPVLVQDMQCRMVPVEVSGSQTEGQFQPMPWTYAPLLLTSEGSPITQNIAPVMSFMASEIEAVGEDSIHKTVLLATSTASRKTGVPAEINLMDLHAQPDLFKESYLPVAMSLEGSFESLYAHRMAPESITNTTVIKKSVPTKQIVVACGQIAANEWQGQEPLPVGYDRYMRTQFGNRDFLVNCILWLADENGLMQLKNKHVQLRLLNGKRSYERRTTIQTISVVIPIMVLAIVGALVIGIRRKKYVK